jgi:membrane protein
LRGAASNGNQGRAMRLINVIGRYLKVFVKSIVDFLKDGGLMLAGSLSYFFMMAVIPFCLFLVDIFSHLVGENQAFLTFFSTKLAGFFPSITSKMTGELRKVISYRGLGTFTLIVYWLLSFQLFSSLEIAVNTIFKIQTGIRFYLSIVRSLLIVSLIFIVIILSFGATSAISILNSLKEIYPYVRVSGITGFLVGYLIPFMLVFMIVTIMYLFLPLRKIRFSLALTGSLITSVLLETAKHLFAFYVVKVAHLGTVYGSLSAVVIFLLWVFYSSCIFLIGAEVVHNLHSPAKRSK